MNERPNSYAQENIWKYLFECGNDLIFCINQLFLLREGRRINVHAAGIADELLHIRLHVHSLDQCPPCHSNHKPHHDIYDGDPCSENAHEQHQASQVYHRGGDQKRECHAQRQTGTCETDKQRYGRAGTERCHRPQQGADNVRPQTMKTTKYLFAPLGREVTLHIGNP